MRIFFHYEYARHINIIGVGSERLELLNGSLIVHCSNPAPSRHILNPFKDHHAKQHVCKGGGGGGISSRASLPSLQKGVYILGMFFFF